MTDDELANEFWEVLIWMMNLAQHKESFTPEMVNHYRGEFVKLFKILLERMR